MSQICKAAMQATTSDNIKNLRFEIYYYRYIVISLGKETDPRWKVIYFSGWEEFKIPENTRFIL